MTAGNTGVIRRFGPMIYLPTFLFSLGVGATLPVVPALAVELGASLATASFVAGAFIVGQLVGNLPGGWIVPRLGERWTMVAAALLALGGVITLLGSSQVLGLSSGMFLIGFSAASFALARHSFMTHAVPFGRRGRALGILGGAYRFGFFVGPFVAAAAVSLFGTTRSVIWLFAGCLLAIVAVVLIAADPTAPTGDEHAPTPSRDGVEVPPGILKTIWQHRRVLSRLGAGAALLSGMRATRLVFLPVWAVSIGLDGFGTALIVGVAGAVDFALFYTGGQVIDRFGRVWAAVPPMIGLGLGLLALALTHDSDDAVAWFVVLSIMLAVANGISSGILLTLGSDFAPFPNPAPFLSAWRTVTDAGGAAVPLLLSTLTVIASISVACATAGTLGLVGAVVLARYMRRLRPPGREGGR